MNKKLLSLALALVMSLSLAVPAMAAEETKEPVAPYTVPADAKGAVVILHSNDVHGAVEGYAKMAALKAMYEAAGAEVLVMDAGDFSQGETYVSVSQGATAVELMNMVGYDVAAPGNHEFDYGYENLKTLEAAASFPILAANITYNDAPTFGDHLVFDKGGVKVGVFGMDTPETATKAHPAKIAGVKFAAGEDMYAVAAAEVAALKKAGANVIVALGHLGIDDETAANANRSIDLLEKVSGIDVFIDGHSHSTEDKIAEKTNADRTVNGTVVTSTGTKFANVGVVTIKNGKITTDCVNTEAITVAEGDPVAARAAEIKAEVEAAYGAKFATSAVKLNGDKAPNGNRDSETNNGDLITDSMVWFATKEDLGVPAENVVAVTNGGGIRAAIEIGDISKNDVNKVLPFGNTVAVVYVSGEALLEALEASTFCTPEAVGGFPQIAGMNITVNTTKAFDQGELYPGTTYAAPKSINRVTINSVNGKAFDPAATYAVVTNDFVAAGGDTYYSFSVSDRITDTGTPLDEALMQYITDELKGVVGEQYAAPQGRITIIAYPADVDANAWWYAAAAYCLDNGILKGTDAGFAANAEITTATVYQTLYNMEKASVKAEGEWFAPAMTWASEQKIFSGDVASFKDGVITRKGTMDIMDAYCAMKGVASKTLFKGNESGDMMLDKSLTRAEWAQVLVNLSSADAEAPAPETPAVPETPATPETPTTPETPALTASSTPVGAGTYSFNAAKDVKGSTDDNAKLSAGTTFANGALTVVINDEKNGKVVQRVKDGSVYCIQVEKDQTSALEFTVTGTADVTVNAASTGGSNDSMVGIVKLDGTKVANNEGKDVVSGTKTTTLTYTGLAAGTYQIVSLETDDDNMNRGVRIHTVDITVK